MTKKKTKSKPKAKAKPKMDWPLLDPGKKRAAMKKAAKKDALVGLTCGCGNTDLDNFQHVEWVIAVRSIYGVSKGALEIAGDSEISDDSGGDEWIECKKCAERQPLPAKVKYI